MPPCTSFTCHINRLLSQLEESLYRISLKIL
jgi:hypothetical protein